MVPRLANFMVNDKFLCYSKSSHWPYHWGVHIYSRGLVPNYFIGSETGGKWIVSSLEPEDLVRRGRKLIFY